MKLIVCILFNLSFLHTAYAQDSTYEKDYLLGTSTIKFVSKCYDSCNAKILFLNLHENESTSVQAAEQYLVDSGGRILKLQHTGERNISFYIKHNRYFFDPNRIFTSTGVKATLQKLSCYKKDADSIVTSFANEILQLVDSQQLVIALHNNTDLNFSIADYQEGGAEEKNAAQLYINPDWDEDDFILTTDSTIYEAIKAQAISVVLQDNQRAIDDGSLSVYAGKKGIPYVNIEAQEDHLEEQKIMIEALLPIIQKFRQQQ